MANDRLQAELQHPQIRKMVKAYETWAEGSCAPVVWPDEKGQFRNGTMTFVRTPSGIVLGVTNSHVADGIDTCMDRPGIVCQVGGAYLNPNQLIARHSSLDLATYCLSDVYLAGVGRKHYATTLKKWPPKRPGENDVIMLGGWPGIYREQLEGNFSFKFAWFAGKVASSSEEKLGILLDIANSKSLSDERIEANAELGGWSGGPVLRVTEVDGLERLELAAIIYEYNPALEIALAIPLSCLNDDGTFAD
jgi:hypothetical protein